MFLNRGESIDPLVVRVSLVVCGDEALDLNRGDVDERRETHVTVEQQISAGLILRPGHDKRLNDADLADGLGDLLELARLLDRIRHGLQRQQCRYGQHRD